MTTTVCDICRVPIDTSKNTIAELPRIAFGPNDKHQFAGVVSRTCNFNTTNFAICEGCLLKAFKEAVAKL